MKTGRSDSSPNGAGAIEQCRRAVGDHRRHKTGMGCGIVSAAAHAPLGRGDGIGPLELFGRVGVVAPGVEHVGQAEVQCRSVGIRQTGIRQKRANRRQVALGQLAAQEGRQLRQGPGVARIVPHRVAEAPLGRGEVAQLFQNRPKAVVGNGEIGLQLDCLAETPKRLVEATLLVVYSAQAVVSFGRVRVKPHRRLAGDDRLLVLFLLFQGSSQVPMGAGQVGLQLQGTAIPGDGVVQPAFFLQGLAHVAVA